MDPKDAGLLRQLIHEAYMSLPSSTAASLEHDLGLTKERLSVAERLLDGKATEDDRASLGEGSVLITDETKALYP